MNPNMTGRSREIERCIRSLVIMLQIFAPHSAAEFWRGMAQTPALQAELWNTKADVWEQQWPTIDADAKAEEIPPDAKIDFTIKVRAAFSAQTWASQLS